MGMVYTGLSTLLLSPPMFDGRQWGGVGGSVVDRVSFLIGCARQNLKGAPSFNTSVCAV
jgi:hypothetical protein